MRLLLDTHVFIWWDAEPARLSARVRSLLADPANELLLSVASIWEMQIKAQMGKLSLRLALADLIREQQETNGLQLLSIDPHHVLALDSLPLHHKDPFDRMLLAQSQTDGLMFLTADSAFAAYGVVPII